MSTCSSTQTSCQRLSSYLSSTLNPYIINVTAAAQLCSSFLCRGNGRCVRKKYNSDHYLHLNAENFKVVRVQKRYLVLGSPTTADLKTFRQRFTCQCYRGLNCTPRTYRELKKALAFNAQQTWSLFFFLFFLFFLFFSPQTWSLNKATRDDTQQNMNEVTDLWQNNRLIARINSVSECRFKHWKMFFSTSVIVLSHLDICIWFDCICK